MQTVLLLLLLHQLAIHRPESYFNRYDEPRAGLLNVRLAGHIRLHFVRPGEGLRILFMFGPLNILQT